MEKSPEIRALVLRLYQAMTTGDLAFFELCISHQPDIVIICPDPSERWVGHKMIRRIIRAQSQEPGRGMHMRVAGADPQAYCQGSIGWVADHGTFEFSDGTRLPFRLTAVFCRENECWKFIRNEDLFGVRLTLE